MRRKNELSSFSTPPFSLSLESTSYRNSFLSVRPSARRLPEKSVASIIYGEVWFFRRKRKGGALICEAANVPRWRGAALVGEHVERERERKRTRGPLACLPPVDRRDAHQTCARGVRQLRTSRGRILRCRNKRTRTTQRGENRATPDGRGTSANEWRRGGNQLVSTPRSLAADQ